MQRMQDKEFDQLFRDRFENAEVEPAAGLWNDIVLELEPKRKGGVSFYWLSAAAVTLLVAAVSLLSPKSETIRLQAPLASIAAKEEQDVPSSDRVSAVRQRAAEPEAKVSRSTPLVIAPRITEKEMQNNLAALQPREQIIHPVVKEPEVRKLPEEAVPASEVMLASADVATVNPGPDMTMESTPQEHKGIRNVGDLINFVVNKVDKRENKIVQFDTDDDNSSLISLNLGIIKFNKKSNK